MQLPITHPRPPRSRPFWNARASTRPDPRPYRLGLCLGIALERLLRDYCYLRVSICLWVSVCRRLIRVLVSCLDNLAHVASTINHLQPRLGPIYVTLRPHVHRTLSLTHLSHVSITDIQARSKLKNSPPHRTRPPRPARAPRGRDSPCRTRTTRSCPRRRRSA